MSDGLWSVDGVPLLDGRSKPASRFDPDHKHSEQTNINTRGFKVKIPTDHSELYNFGAAKNKHMTFIDDNK